MTLTTPEIARLRKTEGLSPQVFGVVSLLSLANMADGAIDAWVRQYPDAMRAIIAHLIDLRTALPARLDAYESRAVVEAERDRATALLNDGLDILAHCVDMPAYDAAYFGVVDDLGRRIGWGALMACATRSWRDCLNRSGAPPGGEHVVGPCRSTLRNWLDKVADEVSG